MTIIVKNMHASPATRLLTAKTYADDTQSPRYRRADGPSTRGGRRASPPIEPHAERAENAEPV